MAADTDTSAKPRNKPGKRRRPLYIALGIVGTTLIALTIVVIYLVNSFSDYLYEAKDGRGDTVQVSIPPGTAFPKIVDLLEEADVIDSPLKFRWHAMRRGVTKTARSGIYEFQDNMKPIDVLDRLVKGVPATTVKVTIPEGLNMLEVFARLEQAGVADKFALEKLARDPEFLAANGIFDGTTVEGYLFPDTYRFVQNSRPESVLEIMIKTYRREWGKVWRKHERAIARLRKKTGWTEHQIVTAASVVEKEAILASERATIAQVIINRLTSKRFPTRLLEMDPTIRYGCMVPVEKSEACQGFNRAEGLYKKHLRDKDNPYNSYQHPGLPPGPICSPRKATLEALVNPDGSDYLFFVAKADGSRAHGFSKTMSEHNAKVAAYRRRRAANQNR